MFVVLIVVLLRRLPASYGTYAAAMLVVNLSARNLDSFERYAMSAFPLVLAVALVTARPDVERPVLAASAAGLVGYSVLGFLGVYVPVSGRGRRVGGPGLVHWRTRVPDAHTAPAHPVRQFGASA